jgi:uncharacterized protein YkwD
MSTKLQFQTLEVRDVPAASITTNLTNGILTIEGTSGNDTILVRQVGTNLTAAGQTFAATSVRSIVVSGESGNDTLTVDVSVTKPSRVYGGMGNDTVVGGTGDDMLFGGFGDDRLYGRSGNDRLFGGGGRDLVDGGLGRNLVSEGSALSTKSSLSTIEQQILTLVNQERASAGLAALTLNVQLNYAADIHSVDMATISNVTGDPFKAHQHTLYGTQQPTLSNRLDLAGYDSFTRSFASGENIAFGYTSAQAVMNAWMNSPGHRANILSANFKEIGISVRADSRGQLFFTQVFGKRE